LQHSFPKNESVKTGQGMVMDKVIVQLDGPQEKIEYQCDWCRDVGWHNNWLSILISKNEKIYFPQRRVVYVRIFEE